MAMLPGLGRRASGASLVVGSRDLGPGATLRRGATQRGNHGVGDTWTPQSVIQYVF